MYSRHEEHSLAVRGNVEIVFAALDDPKRLSSHMNKRTWKMGGGMMETIVDAGQGKRVGSHIILRGRVFGIPLFVEEVVTERQPPTRKVWETTGTPRLLVIGPYRMAFELLPNQAHVQLRVALDYELPTGIPGFILGRLFGGAYARWCVRRVTSDARNYLTNPRRFPDQGIR
jgi:hypothetical protein